MPTASTAQILGNNESFEPYTSNIYSRRVLSGEFQVLILYLNCVKRYTYTPQNTTDWRFVSMTPAIYVDIETWWQTTFVMTNNVFPRNFTKNIQIGTSTSYWFPGEILVVMEKQKKTTRNCNLSTKSMNLGFHWDFQHQGNWTNWNFLVRIVFRYSDGQTTSNNFLHSWSICPLPCP